MSDTKPVDDLVKRLYEYIDILGKNMKHWTVDDNIACAKMRADLTTFIDDRQMPEFTRFQLEALVERIAKIQEEGEKSILRKTP